MVDSTLSGLTGMASAIPGAPDLLGSISAGSKTLSGLTNLVNVRQNLGGAPGWWTWR